MVIYRKRNDKSAIVGSVALEPPGIGESSRVVPCPTGGGGAMVPCFGKRDGEYFTVELTHRDLCAVALAAGYTLTHA